MDTFKMRSLWGLWLTVTAVMVTTVMVIALAGCTGAPAPTAAPTPAATAPSVVAPATIAVPTEVALAPDDEGGVTSPEPALAALPTTITPALQATDAPTEPPAPSPTPVPTTVPTATPVAPAPTATVAATVTTAAAAATVSPTVVFHPSQDPFPLQIEVMRQQVFPGSEIKFEQTLAAGANYKRYIVSYQSDGYKIYALMTVPDGEKPATGWPVIVFNHGYIPPKQYRTTERYVAYVDAIARSGYIVFKSDYRGHGSSEGPADGAYYAPDYTDDVLNALASLKAYKDADPNRIGMWGHSMGGSITLRAMVVSKDIKAGVIWGGVVAPYPDIFARTANPRRPTQVPHPPSGQRYYTHRNWQQEIRAKYGTPEQNPQFWASISPNSYLAGISGPVQLDHSVTDEEVPVEASQKLYQELTALGKTVELYTYPGDNHNISANFNLAMQRSIAFFDKYVKGQ